MVPLQKGKIMDMMKRFSEAAIFFKKALGLFKLNMKNLDGEAQTLGQLEFRYGWALIRSKKDLQKGIEMLKEAETKLTGNFDIKIKLAQILYQERGEFKESLNYINQAIEINKEDPDSHFLKGKILVKLKQYKKGITSMDLCIEKLFDQGKEPKPNHFFHIAQAHELQRNIKLALQNFKKAL